MKINRVIFPLNNNKNYTEYWNVFGKVWKEHWNITPTMIFVGTEQELNSNNFDHSIGDIVRLDPVPAVTEEYPDWSVTWSIIYGAALFEKDICITHGIDQLPLSKYFFDETEKISEDKFIVGFGDAYKNYGPNHLGYYNNVTKVMYPSSHLVGSGNTFKSIYSIDDKWETEIIKVYNSRSKYLLKNKFYKNSSWGLDECYSSECISKYDQSNIVYFDFFWSFWYPRRIDRGGQNLNYSCDLIKNGYYSELHAFRPYRDHKAKVDKIIKCLTQ
jgi:hypothetical protein